MEMTRINLRSFEIYRNVYDIISGIAVGKDADSTTISKCYNVTSEYLANMQIDGAIAEFKAMPFGIDNGTFIWEVRVKEYAHNDHYLVISDQGIKIKRGNI